MPNMMEWEIGLLKKIGVDTDYLKKDMDDLKSKKEALKKLTNEISELEKNLYEKFIAAHKKKSEEKSSSTKKRLEKFREKTFLDEK